MTQSAVELQWKVLWETQSSDLLDPNDVHAVLDALQTAAVNQLSPTEVTLVQRRVRHVVKLLLAEKGKIMMGRVFYASNTPAELEARSVVEKYHLLNATAVARIFRPCYIGRHETYKHASSHGNGHGNSSTMSSSGSISNSGGNAGANAAVQDKVNIIENAYTLMLHLSEQLWDRVADIALQASVTAGLEMDVNQQVKAAHAWKMPRPSVVPDVTEPPVLPPGASFQSLVFLTATALRGKRAQRLQLLFYLLMSPAELSEFLVTHPAGGVPTWLLEVGRETVASLASLTHYHYYGHAFLPRHVVQVGKFVPSQSRRPVTVQSAAVMEAVKVLLLTPEPALTVATSSRDLTDNASTLPLAHSLPKRGVTTRLKRSSGSHTSTDSISDITALLDASSHNGPSVVLQRLNDVAEHVKPDYQDKALENSKQRLLQTQVASLKAKRSWTLEDFSHWAEEALDDAALEAMMHRLFAAGILPSHSTERELVQQKWKEWQLQIDSILSVGEPDGSFEMITTSVQELLKACHNGDGSSSKSSSSNGHGSKILSTVWGGMGGIDGGGGVGHGVLYCVDKRWWNDWTKYVGWSWVGERPAKCRSMKRPGSLSTEALLDRDPESTTTPGTLGSYEVMQQGLKKNNDYVLVPPGVWDVLYEMYGGGPPLPRMVKPPQRKYSDTYRISMDPSESSYHDSSDDIDAVLGSFDDDNGSRVLRLPDGLSVSVHPWIIYCHLCDPQQPYRRGDAGPMTVRVMVTPDQPLWRMYVELITRFQLQAYKAFGSDGRGQARLWKKVEPTAGKDPVPRYGPWNLVCKNRHGLLANRMDLRDHYKEFTANWQAYADYATVESIGLVDRDHVMLEFAVLNKSGELIWPREAAAKAGHVRRLAEEGIEFRRTLQGVDVNGSMLPVAPILVGMEVDAMDSTGRWYPVKVTAVEISDEDTDEEPEEYGNEEEDAGDRVPTESTSIKKVKVDFQVHGGHTEWIDVESDRLAKLGRFTGDAEKQSSVTEAETNGTNRSAAGDAKAKPASPVKKVGNGDNSAENGKICLLPGYGACGLTNLGNTCYVNSAVQCISYLPLLRAYLLSAQYKAKGDLNKDNPLGTGGRLLEEFAELLRTMWSAKFGEKSPTRFRAQLAKVNTQFSGADQQDAQEFLNFILDVLHEDSNKVRTKPYVEALEDDWVKKSQLSRVGDEAWRR